MGHVPDRLAQILSVMLDERRKNKKIVGRKECGGSVEGLNCLTSTYSTGKRKTGLMCEDVFGTSSQEKESTMKLNLR